MAWFISRAELARKGGVSRAAITQLCKGPLAEACQGKLVDLDHPAVRAWLKGRGVEVPARTPTRGKDPAPHPVEKGDRTRRRSDAKGSKEGGAKRRRDAPAAGPIGSEPAVGRAADAPAPRGPSDATAEDIERYAHLPLRELAELFGDAAAFKEWLASLKLIEEVREKNLKNDETEGRLIERDLVASHVFGAIETSHRRLLGDSAKTIARRVYTLARSGTPVEKAEEVVRSVISSQLEPVKTRVARALRDG